MSENSKMDTRFVSTDDIRSLFSKAMSDMYRLEVPAYGTLLDLVETNNEHHLQTDKVLLERLNKVEDMSKLSEQRHGAIRLGKASELAMMRRIFSIMGMFPVGYYDLSVANVPVHSTAFRPVDSEAIRSNPFRVFTSLLRLELIEDEELRHKAQEILNKRDIFGEAVRLIVAQAEEQGGLNKDQVVEFINAIVNVFKWHSEAAITADLYSQFLQAHPLIADVVSFKGPHINHLTPRTLDIDEMQSQIHKTGAQAKAVIEGPPKRLCPILLRQTAFLAIKEPVRFLGSKESKVLTHAARFGEIEQRGCALTRKGRELYDTLLHETRSLTRPLNDGSNLDEYLAEIQDVFSTFPDDYHEMYKQGLAYFKYSLVNEHVEIQNAAQLAITELIAKGVVRIDPITYEDFLPVSAAGIFQSNLGEQGEQDFSTNPNQSQFERDLGEKVADEFALYEQMQQLSLNECLAKFT